MGVSKGRRLQGKVIFCTSSCCLFTVIIILLTTSIVCFGRRFAVVGGRVATGEGLLNRIIGTSLQRRGVTSCKSSSTRARYSAFVSATTIKPSFSRASSTSTSNDTPDNNMESSATEHMPSELCSEEDTCTQQQSYLLSSKVSHPSDSTLWMYHLESTTSTMDDAKFIVEKKFLTDVHPTTKDGNTDDHNVQPTSFLISATSQTNGRGTTKRNWKSSQRGNALFTIGIPQSSWMSDLKSKNDGRMVPLTLLPLKVGSLVALHTQRLISECSVDVGETQKQQIMPRVTVKWPNDVLLHTNQGSHEKIAGILIESSRDWFLIGIGINIGYAPNIPSEGVDHGRKATCLSRYCNTPPDEVANAEEEEYWIKISKKLATDIAYDLHSWLHPTLSTSLINNDNVYSGEAILNQWKSYIDWNMELTLRDTPKRERVRLKEILEDGRVVVQEIETGLSRTLVSDYFL